MCDKFEIIDFSYTRLSVRSISIVDCSYTSPSHKKDELCSRPPPNPVRPPSANPALYRPLETRGFYDITEYPECLGN